MSTTLRSLFFTALLTELLATLLATEVCMAQPFPTKPLRLIVGSPPGGGNDIVARILAAKISESVGQQMVVDNRGGANGIIGMELVARAAPDGHTLYMGTTGHLSVNPSLYSKLPFDIERDFVPLTEVVWLPFLLYLHPSVPARTLAELIAHAKANPGKLAWSSSGDGGLPQLTGELLKPPPASTRGASRTRAARPHSTICSRARCSIASRPCPSACST